MFRVDPAKVPPNGVRARCSVCGAIVRISVGVTTPLTNTAIPRLLTPHRTPALGGLSPTVSPELRRPMPAMSEPLAPNLAYPSRPTPSISTPGLVPQTAAAATQPGVSFALPLRVAQPTPASEAEVVAFVRPEPTVPVGVLDQSTAHAAATDRESMPVPVGAQVTRQTPPAVPIVAPPALTPRPLVPLPPPSPGQLVGMPVPTPAAAAAAVPASGGEPRRVINPFLRSDPVTRARRLARALVSDMVAYQPAKHADGLANGTLKQLFRDEIRKSYDEYVEQVGREVAESTAFFQDALNEVLAQGRRVF